MTQIRTNSISQTGVRSEHGFESFALWIGADARARLTTDAGAVVITDRDLLEHVARGTRAHPIVAHINGPDLLRRLVGRFADRLHTNLDDPRTDRLVFRESLAFLIETEVFWHWPVRHLARHLARTTPPDKFFAIELPRLSLRYGLLWDDNEIWPLTLAWEFARAGRRAVLYLEKRSDHPIEQIEILPDRNVARPDRTAFDHLADAVTAIIPGRKVLCPKTVRNPKQVAKSLGRRLRLMTSLDGRRPLVRLDIAPLRDEIGVVHLPLEAVGHNTPDGMIDPPGGMTAHVGRWPPGGLARTIIARLDQAAAATYRKAEKIVRKRRIDRLDTADHLNFEAAALSLAVARSGGAVHLWSHASNPIAVNYRAPIFRSVTVPTTISAEAWRSKFPDVDVRLAPWTVLPQITLDAPRDRSGNVTVVMFGIRGFLGAMPRFDIAAHEASLRRLLALIADAAGVRLIYKPKDRANAAWFKACIDPNGLVELSNVKFDVLSDPNMIFASPTIPSTAIIEGICRGVPAVLLRDTPAFDHVPVDEAVIPIEGADALMAQIAALRDFDCYSALQARQEAWLRSIVT